MERKKINYNRNFTLILYPEDKTHMEALEYIEKNYDCAYITHDKDITEDGEIKKEHIHCVIRVGNNPRWRSAIAEEIGISEGYIEGCNLIKQLKYLIHAEQPEKYQYNIENVKGNLKNKLIKELENDDESENEKITKMIEFIEDFQGYLSLEDFTNWCINNKCWKALTKSQYIFSRMIENKNRRERQD